MTIARDFMTNAAELLSNPIKNLGFEQSKLVISDYILVP